MEWQPNPDNLNELMTLLSNTQSNDNKVQQENNMKLNELRKVDDYINYLLYVLINLQEAAGPVRAVAGLLLKNNVRQDFEKIPKHVLEYVKIQSLEAIGDNDTLVRHTL
ncbi:Transportin-1, partial [Linderina macrospora]